MERLMLLDGNGLIYRGYFALPPLTTSKGELVNAVFGFCSIVLRGIQDLQPDYVAVAFDLPGPTFRHEQYAQYKATRQRMPDDLRDQFPKVRDVVAALRIPVYELPGYEADDVIGTITVETERLGLDTTIVTGDLDMLQLVTDRTRLMTTRSGVENTILYDPEKIADRFDLVAGQMIDYKALKGDPTDNIPGVPGVGEKTAAKLIREFETLDALYERVAEVKPDKLRDKLVEHRDSVFMGRDLSTIVRDLPVSLDLDAARIGDYDRETVIRLFREFEFRSLIERLPPISGESAAQTVEALRGVAADGSVPAARVAGQSRPSGWGPGRPPRPTADPGSLQLSLDFDAVAGALPRDEGAARGPDDRIDRGCRARRPAGCPRRRDRGSGPDRAGPWRPGRRARTVARRAGRGRGRPPGRRPAPAARDAPRLRHRRGGRSGRRDRRRGGRHRASAAGGTRRYVARRARGEADPGGPVRGRSRGVVARGRVRHPGGGLHPQRLPAQPDHRGCRRRATRSHPAAGRGTDLPDPRRPGSPVRAGRPRAAGAAAGRSGTRSAVCRDRAATHHRAGADGGDRRGAGPRSPAPARHRIQCGDPPTRAGDLHRCRARIQPGQPEAAGADPVLRAEPPEGEADQDRLFDRRLGPGGPAGRPSDGRQAAGVADLHEAALDLCRGPADPDRDGRPPAYDVPPGGRRDRAPVVVRPEPPEHPDPDPARTPDPQGLRGRRPGSHARRRRLQPDRAADPRPRVGRRTPQGCLRPEGGPAP